MARRRKFNPSGAQIAVAAGAAILGGIVLYDTVYAKPAPAKKKKKPEPSCDPSPYQWNEGAVRAGIEDLVTAGERDATFIATEVASSLFGDYPGGGNIEFPPAPGAPKGVACVWSLVIYMVDIIFKEKGIKNGKKDGGFNWEVHGAGDLDNYPWETPSLHPDNYPTPGVFIDIGNKEGAWDTSEGLDKMMKVLLAQSMAMANLAGGNVDVGLAYAQTTKGKNLRRDYRNLIQCSVWNDALYGQTNIVAAGGKEGGSTHMMNNKGRGLNWYPRHADNLSRMAQGKKPKRTTSASGAKLASPNSGSSQMLLWLPAVDLQALGNPNPVIKPLNWSNGSSTKEPPPMVQDLGIDMSGVGLSGGPGC